MEKEGVGGMAVGLDQEIFEGGGKVRDVSIQGRVFGVVLIGGFSEVGRKYSILLVMWIVREGVGCS